MVQVDGAGSDGLVGPGVACWVGISGASDAWKERACRHGGSSAIRNRNLAKLASASRAFSALSIEAEIIYPVLC